MSQALLDLRHDREVLNDRIDGLNVCILSMQKRMANMFQELRSLRARVDPLASRATVAF